MLPDILMFWGKARPSNTAGAGMHPLLAHSLDVAAVALLLPRRLTFGLAGQTLGFLVALHDIGKFSSPFQAQAAEYWPTAALGSFTAENRPPPGPRHDALGLYLLRDVLRERLDDVLPPGERSRRGWTDSHRGHLFRALAGHHGRPPQETEVTPGANVLCERCLAAAGDFVEAMQEVFRPSPLIRPTEQHDMARLGWHLAGLVTLADWLGSGRHGSRMSLSEAVADPAAYFWSHALPRAAAALAASGLATAAPSRLSPAFAGCFPALPCRRRCNAGRKPCHCLAGPVLAVIEDLTGSGKTEAAVTLAHRLLAAGRADGIFLGLPTMATANAMFGRLANSYRSLFVPEARPSLALAHSRADLDPRFAAALQSEVLPPAARTVDPADEPAEAHCAAWLAEDRRRALLAQVGVGTLDQALLAALPVRHAPLRLQGLTGKVLIVDEAHAFDPYMRRELVALLRFHAALGGSAVLLSATLPLAVRQGSGGRLPRWIGGCAAGVGAGGIPAGDARRG